MAALLVGGLYFENLGPFARPPQGSDSVAIGQTYFAARSAAQSESNSTLGGPWFIDDAVGYVVRTYDPNVNLEWLYFANLNWKLDCAPVNLSMAKWPSLTLLGFTGNITSGQAPTWLFQMENGQGFLVIVVSNGAASVLIDEHSCNPAVPLHTVPNAVGDSSTVMASVATGGGEAFLNSHPNANATIQLVEGSSSPIWSVTLETCSPVTGPDPVRSAGSWYQASLGSQGGGVIGPPTNGTVCFT